jgi:hypothetical protein
MNKIKTPPYTITVEDAVIEIKPKNKMNFTLEEMQEIVGGKIKLLNLKDDSVMVMNEEARSKELSLNPIATSLAASVMRPSDYVVGNVLITPRIFLNVATIENLKNLYYK